MGSSPYATLRPVLVDGSLRARIEGAPVDIVISADGRNAVVTHVGGRRETESVTRVSLDDGRVEPLAIGSALRPRDLRWFTSGEGRVVDALATPDADSTWARDSAVVARREGESVLGLSPDGRWVVLCRVEGLNGTFRAVRVDDGAQRVFEAVRSWTADGVVIADGFVALVTRSNELTRLRLEDGDLRAVTLPDDRAWNLVVERGRARVVCTNGSLVVVYELDALREVSRFDVPAIARLCDAAGGRMLAIESSAPGSGFVVRALDDGAATPLLDGPITPHAALTPDGARAVCVGDGVLRVVDVASGRRVELHDGPDSFTCRIVWSPDGRRLASVGRDNSVRVLDVERGRVAWTFEGCPPRQGDWSVSYALFTPDGSALLLASHLGFTLWSLSTGQEIARFEWSGTSAPFLDVAVSPDGRLLAVVGLSAYSQAVVTLLDLSAEMRVVAVWGLPYAQDPRTAALRFEGVDTLRWSVRHAQHRGRAATYRVSLDGRVLDCAQRALRGAAHAISITGDDRWVVVDRERISVERTGITAPVQGHTLFGLACLDPLDARAGVAAIAARVRGEWGFALAVYDCTEQRLIATVRCARTPVGAALSPDGSRVAVRYGDGACEVFSIDRG